MKHGGFLKRTTPLRKSGSTKAKKVARQKAFYSSAAWKRLRQEALARAGHRCEYVEVGTLGIGLTTNWSLRCAQTERLQVHHTSGTWRFGGDERPENLVCYCAAHHAMVERRDHPHRHPRRSVA